MVAGCGNNCIKYILFVINFLFFVMGAVAIGLGIWALVDKNNMKALTSLDKSGKIAEFNGVGLLQSGAIALIVGGSFLFITGFAGCCGAVKEVKCLLGVYIAIVLLVVVAEVVAAALAIAFSSKIEDTLKEGLKNGIQTQYDGNYTSSEAFSRALDFAQVEFDCCGLNNGSDFYNSKWQNITKLIVPPTCCEQKDKNLFLNDNQINLRDPQCPNATISESNKYTNKGCFQALKDWVMKHAGVIIGIAFGIAGIEVLAVVFAACLFKAIGSDTCA